MTKKKHFNKNPYKKKQKSATHPYVELIQSEITALEDKLVRKEKKKKNKNVVNLMSLQHHLLTHSTYFIIKTSLQNIETNLTQEQEMDKLVTKATLERYKETLQNTVRFLA